MRSPSLHDVLITGMGMVSPIGITLDEAWQSIEAGKSGVQRLPELAEAGWIAPFGGIVTNFVAKDYVQPRKSLKVMCREMQFAAGAAEMAWQHAGMEGVEIPPERAGVVGAAAGHQFCDLEELEPSYQGWMSEQNPINVEVMPKVVREELSPLWMLKYLPNLNACHIGIRRDFRGPNNSISIGDTSSLAALEEAANVIRRGAADLMIAGGSSSNLNMMRLIYHRGARLSRYEGDPAEACRPFDAQRSGMVYGEGATFFILESRAHATRRGANPLAEIVATSQRFEPAALHREPTGDSLRRAIKAVFEKADFTPQDIGYVNTHGNSTLEDDPIEAQAIEAILGDVPVTAPKSYFGNLNASSGAAELAVSLLAMQRGVVPPTLNYQHPDPACPVNVVTEPIRPQTSTFLAINHAPSGQAAAMILREA